MTRYDKILKSKNILNSFRKNISRVVVEYGKKGKHGFSRFTADEWYLNYENVSVLKTVRIIVFYEKDNFEVVKEIELIKKTTINDRVTSVMLFIKMFFYYVNGGFKDLLNALKLRIIINRYGLRN